MIEDNVLDKVIDDVVAELERAETKYPEWPVNLVEQGAIVAEEAGELLKACNNIHHVQKPGSREELIEEAVQTAAMAIRFILNVDVTGESSWPY
jgi:NTP pyrophosphatase (non-canonical NTP hydrolase)